MNIPQSQRQRREYTFVPFDLLPWQSLYQFAFKGMFQTYDKGAEFDDIIKLQRSMISKKEKKEND